MGPKPFSEPCTKALSDFISTIEKDLVAYIDFHSYKQLLMIPYGYTTQHLDNYEQMVNNFMISPAISVSENRIEYYFS